MPRYIDANRLYAIVDQANDIALKGLLDAPKTLENGELNPMYIRYLTLVVERTHIKEEIFDAPTADVVEVKKGKWIPYEFGSERWHKCSVCGKADEYINERGIEAVRKFCPNCGAEMRE